MHTQKQKQTEDQHNNSKRQGRNLMKFVNEEVNSYLGKSTPTIWLNYQLNIRQTLTPTQANPV